MTYASDAKPPFYHGTRADLKAADLLTPARRLEVPSTGYET